MANKYNHAFFLVFLIAHLAHATAEFETVVQASQAPPAADTIRVSADEEKATPAYPWVSLAQAGISAAPTSGALSFGSIRFRGFSSPQMRITVDGYDLSDTGTGIFDTYDLPLFASDRFSLESGVADGAVGGSLKVNLPVPKIFTAKSRGSFGSNGFGLVDVVAGSGDLGSSRALIGLQLGSTRGDFAFEGGALQNNDHSRMMGFFKSEHSFKSADLEFFVLGRQHEGGLAGSIGFLTPTSRLLSQKLLFGTSLFWEIGSYPLTIKWQSRFDRTHFRDALSTSDVSFMDNSLTFKFDKHYTWADTFAFLESSLNDNQVLDGRFRRLSTRHEIGVNTAPFSFWSMRFKRSVSIEAHSDAGWYFGFATNISAKPIEPLTIGLRFGKNGRPPTLSEMYSPTGLIAGNPNLEPEKVYDSSIYGIYDVNSKLRLNLDLYYAHMSKAILYLRNMTSNVFEPTNADHVHRGGVGLSMDFRPSELFESKTRVDYLWTKIKETNAPYPGATPLAVSIDGRVGKENGIYGRLNTILNAGASADLNGTFFTKPYVLVNASLHVPLLDHARFIFSVTNLADVTWAQHAYQFPMPGREFFVTLELFS